MKILYKVKILYGVFLFWFHVLPFFVKIRHFFLSRNTAVPQGLGGIFILTRRNEQKMKKVVECMSWWDELAEWVGYWLGY
jgi:hypothetical protein